MRSDAPTYDVPRPGHAAAADYDAYAQAEHMLRCYGAAYVCRHPELLFGRVLAVDPDHQLDPTPRPTPYDSSGIYARCGASHHDTGDDLLTRIVSGYQMLDEIFTPYRTPIRADERSALSDTRTSTVRGDQQ